MRKIRLKKLKNGAYIQFLNDVLTIVQSETLVKKTLEDRIIPLSAQVTKLERVYEVRGHELTVKIQDADKKRDSTFDGLKGIVKAYLKHHDSNLKAYAKQVMLLIGRYGMDMSNQTYQVETESIKLLVEQLRTLESNQGILSHLCILSWVNDLDTFNNDFNTLYLERNEGYARLGLSSVSSGRKETDVLYYKLIEYIEACIVIKKEALIFIEIRDRILALSKTYNEGLYLSKVRDESEEQ